MSTDDRSPQGRGPQHTTHYDDCGCQSAALRARIAELERRDSEFDKLHAVQVARVEILIGAKAAQAARIATLVEQQERHVREIDLLGERIATLEAEIAAAKELADSYRLAMDDSDHRGMGWMAHAATLRDALDVWWRVDLADGTDMSSEEYAELWAEAKHKTTVALASTPAASLAAYRNSVLEEAAKACDERKAFYDGLAEQAMAEAEVDAEAEGVAVSTLDADFYDEKAGACHQLAESIRALAAQEVKP